MSILFYWKTDEDVQIVLDSVQVKDATWSHKKNSTQAILGYKKQPRYRYQHTT